MKAVGYIQVLMYNVPITHVPIIESCTIPCDIQGQQYCNLGQFIIVSCTVSQVACFHDVFCHVYKVAYRQLASIYVEIEAACPLSIYTMMTGRESKLNGQRSYTNDQTTCYRKSARPTRMNTHLSLPVAWTICLRLQRTHPRIYFVLALRFELYRHQNSPYATNPCPEKLDWQAREEDSRLLVPTQIGILLCQFSLKSTNLWPTITNSAQL